MPKWEKHRWTTNETNIICQLLASGKINETTAPKTVLKLLNWENTFYTYQVTSALSRIRKNKMYRNIMMTPPQPPPSPPPPTTTTATTTTKKETPTTKSVSINNNDSIIVKDTTVKQEDEVGSNAGKRQRWSMNDFSKIRHLIATGQIDNTTTPEMVMDLLNIGDDKYDLAQVRDALAFIRLVEQSSNINMNNVTLLNDNSNNQKDRKSGVSVMDPVKTNDIQNQPLSIKNDHDNVDNNNNSQANQKIGSDNDVNQSGVSLENIQHEMDHRCQTESHCDLNETMRKLSEMEQQLNNDSGCTVVASSTKRIPVDQLVDAAKARGTVVAEQVDTLRTTPKATCTENGSPVSFSPVYVMWKWTGRSRFHLTVAINIPSGLCNGNNLANTVRVSVASAGTKLRLDLFMPPGITQMMNFDKAMAHNGIPNDMINIILQTGTEEMACLAKKTGSCNSVDQIKTFAEIDLPITVEQEVVGRIPIYSRTTGCTTYLVILKSVATEEELERDDDVVETFCYSDEEDEVLLS